MKRNQIKQKLVKLGPACRSTDFDRCMHAEPVTPRLESFGSIIPGNASYAKFRPNKPGSAQTVKEVQQRLLCSVLILRSSALGT